MKSRARLIQIFLSIVFSISILSCGLGGGGGGGDGDDLEAANASITADPMEIDSGDRSRIRVFLSSINKDGVLLKFRYSNKFAYARNSSTLIVDGDEIQISPAVNEAVGSDFNGETYLVYDIPNSALGEETNAEVTMVLEGLARTTRSKIEVDADFNDPNQTISQKFTVLRPEFEPQDFVELSVTDDSGEIRPTVTSTPTITYTPSLTVTATPTRTPRPSNTPTPE